MFEREIKFIYDFNLNRVKKLGTFLTFEEIAQADLHPAVLRYISAEIDFLIFEDRQKLLKNSVFDYSSPAIANYFSLIGDEIKRSKKFSLEYINKLLLQSSSFIVNYLIRPRWALIKFLFGNETEKSVSELKQVLNYVYFYSYFRDTLISYYDKKNIITTTVDETEKLIAKIDDLSLEQYKSSIFNNAIESISSFLNTGSVQTNKIPVQAVLIFLKDKNLFNHIEIFQNEFNTDENRAALTNDVKKLLNSLDLSASDIEQEPQEEFVEDNWDTKPQAEFEEVHDVAHHDDELHDEYDYVDELISGNTKNDSFEAEETKDDNVEETNYDEDSLGDDFLTDEKLEERVKAEFKKEEETETFEENEHETAADDINIGIEDNLIEDEPIIDEPIEMDEIEENENDQEGNIGSTIQNITGDDIAEDEIPKSEEIEGVESMHSEYDFEEVEDSKENKKLIATDEEQDSQSELLHDDVEENETDFDNTHLVSDDEDDEPELFPEHTINDSEEDDVADLEENTETPLIETQSPDDDQKTDLTNRRIDISEILENKNTSKILRGIFDYDMEDFTNTIERISECRDFDEAQYVLENLYKTNRIKPTSKEALIFNEMIQEYFNKI
ncbi:MAG: hypothetical protein PHW27_05370 [Melioribacteraceae bacterium]|nr:hypothetical protein [Melioribacteraceae bacterium]MDD3557985.1 hypothetical protein [Melioribacteraceae bacterium]